MGKDENILWKSMCKGPVARRSMGHIRRTEKKAKGNGHRLNKNQRSTR